MRKIIECLKNPNLFLYYLDKKRIITIEDKKYLEILYKKVMNKKLDLNNPKTFNEKLQWLKLYDRNPKYNKMVDKFEVKKYVSDIIGQEYIIPTLGVYDRVEDINFEELPDKFVIKCTHDSGSVMICKNKKEFDINNCKKALTKELKINYFYQNREWPYKDIKPRVLAEKYMQNKKDQSLKDYKFYCFNGEPKYLYVSEGLEDHSTAKISFFDMNFEFAGFYRDDFRKFDKKPEKPINFEKMKEIAKKLSQEIPFLRVDLYEIEGKIYFSELTFTPCAGFMPFNPEEFDGKLGNLLELPCKQP